MIVGNDSLVPVGCTSEAVISKLWRFELDHASLIHAEVCIACYADTDEILRCCTSDVIIMFADGNDEEIPFGNEIDEAV